jgi:nucleoside-diphosphate-sugar epimerase
MNILLTGHRGFIGSNLLPILEEADHKVYTIDLKDGQDLNDCNLDYDVDMVIHLAGLSGVRDSINKPTEYWRNNVQASQRLFTKFKDKRLIYASSSTAKEPDKNPYAMSKYTMENIAPANSVGLRFTTVYGPLARETMFIPKLLKKDVEYINTNHKRDFIHVADVCRAIIKVATQSFTGVIDVGTGVSRSLQSIVDKVGLKNLKKQNGDRHERTDNMGNIAFLKTIGWKPEIDLFDYLEKHYV